ncbi:polyketide cyclase [Mucilaginibacter sp. PAMC 26640]|nr:polyketide cyclase [Mucilaginibacter sp. PAMC 26640]
MSETKEKITVNTDINAPLGKVWELWTKPEHIVHWNNASDDWHTPKTENDLRVGGSFLSSMAAKDGSASFEFGGTYTAVEEHKKIAYELADGRQVEIIFTESDGATKIEETFDPENTHSAEMQQQGWQAILTNFKKYTENYSD